MVQVMTGTRAPANDGDAAEPAAVPARPASTVMLVRDGSAGVEAFMLRRAPTMSFAPGALVFPGGAVDPQDSDPSLPWAGPGTDAWARALGLPASRAVAHVAAAVRETFEECGVLLASPPASSTAPLTAPATTADRQRLINGEHTLTQLLQARGLVLRSDWLLPWDHWVTPRSYPRRYDTRFFLARCPRGQSPRHVGGESTQSRWWPAAEALRQARSGDVHLMYPTRACLVALAAAPTVAELSPRR